MAFTKDSGIYAIVNKANGKRYVGSAVDLERRYSQHRNLLLNGNHHSTYLQNAWNKYGEESFEFRVLLYCDKELLLFFEQRLIDQRAEYNLNPTAGSGLGRHHTKEAKKKMSASKKGKKFSAEHKAKLSAAKKGKKVSAEHLANIRVDRNRRRGIPRSVETKAKISAGHKGVLNTPEHNAALSAAAKGKPWTNKQYEVRGLERRSPLYARERKVDRNRKRTDLPTAGKGVPWTDAQYECRGLEPPKR